jgi:DNA-binding transcriptional LysR family regulator
VLEAVRTEVLQRTEFDPASSDRTFTVVMPDLGEAHYLPPLLAALETQAPGVSLRTIALPPFATAAALESGQADLALGYYPDLQKAGFIRQKLVDVPLVGLVRQDHPTIGDSMTLDEYLSARHAVMRPEGRGQEVDELLAPEQAPRRVVAEVSHFMSLLTILEGSDLLAVVPRDLAQIGTRHARLRTVRMPIPMPSVTIHQFWHERVRKDAGHAWMRGLIHAVCTAERAR